MGRFSKIRIQKGPNKLCPCKFRSKAFCGVIQGCGGGGSVRRRNTLHVVGGRQIIICHKRGLRGERIFYKIK
jgi:hypothetical protein